MFMLNIGHRKGLLSSLDIVQGATILPSGNNYISLANRPPLEAKRIMFDPQLYLSDLEVIECKNVCARLASYPYFNVPDIPNILDYSGDMKGYKKEILDKIGNLWNKKRLDDIHVVCRRAIGLQLDIPCTHIILPCPAIREREDEAKIQADWLDEAIDAADELLVGQPLLATVAIWDTELKENSFKENGFLDTVVDQISSREGIDGVYMVIIQNNKDHPFKMSPLITRAYFHLCNAFGKIGYDTIYPNFADVLGLICLGLGATDVGTGQSFKLRKMSITSFKDSAFGKSFPHYYSHKAMTEFRSGIDLQNIVEKKLVGRITDITPFSQSLINELRRPNGLASNLPSWVESQNNTTTAHKHFLYRLAKEVKRLNNMDIPSRQILLRDQLESAAANTLFIKRRFGKENKIKGNINPAEKWLDLYDPYI